ncbi:hypothetical protein LDENG_00207240 [Lucifuga dentata]|nr:hypothetical protein LDENG_00207240 [Lucifuga dentata]
MQLKMSVCADEEDRCAASSCPSMKTNKSKSRCSDVSPEPGASHTKVHQQRADPPVPSCVSMKSNWSMYEPYNFSDGQKSAAERVHLLKSEVSSGQHVQQHPADLDSIFMVPA